MRNRNSLRFKVARAVWTFCSGNQHNLGHSRHIREFGWQRIGFCFRQLKLVAEDYALHYSAAGGPATDSSYIQAYDQIKELPPELIDWASETPEYRLLRISGARVARSGVVRRHTAAAYLCRV